MVFMSIRQKELYLSPGANPAPTEHPGYNLTVKAGIVAIAALGVSITFVSGCKRDIQNDDAVKQGVQTYLAKRPDLLAMDVNVTSVAYRQDEATATVHFQAKGDKSPNTGMDMQYVLKRNGNQWVVKGRAGADAHGAQGMPQGMAPGGAAPQGGSIGAMPQTLPPGHPTVGAGGSAPTGTLPPGHPAIPPKKTGQEK